MNQCDWCTEDAVDFCPSGEHGQACEEHLEDMQAECDCDD